jgi:hypothetical protein
MPPDIRSALLDLPANNSADYRIAMALVRRWVLISEGVYGFAIPAGGLPARRRHADGHTPLTIWQCSGTVNGKTWPRRPTDAEFAEGRAEVAAPKPEPADMSREAINERLDRLCSRYHAEAKEIDPTITGAMVYKDEPDRNVCGVWLQRGI